MHTAAKAQMITRIARDVVDVRVHIFALVAVSRAIGKADKLTGLHLHAVDDLVLQQDAAEALRRGVIAQRFLDRLADQLRLSHQTAPRVGEGCEVERKHGHEA